MAIEIVDLPIKNDDVPSSYVNVLPEGHMASNVKKRCFLHLKAYE